MKCRLLKQRFKGERLSVIGERLAPFVDVTIFVITLLVANYFWKFTVIGDEYGDQVTWLGWDITAPFEWVSCHEASIVYTMVSWFRDTVHLVNGSTIRFDSGPGTIVVWSCTGLKQAFIWFWLILTVRGGWLHKLWYIPFGWVCCYAVNIVRIFLIALIIEHHPGWFHMLHDGLFKYLFYVILFGLWLIFVEKIRPNASSR